MEPEQQSRDRKHTSITLIAVVVIVIGAGVYLAKSMLDVPRGVVDEGREVLRDIQGIVQAFNEGTVTTTFVSYATEVSGSNYLQFATLKQMEVFERTDARATLWGQFALPEVVVEARAPVEYTYYLDLNGHWEMRLEAQKVYVTAPQIQFNTPSVDASAIRYQVREGSIFRDEEEVLATLRDGLMEMSRQRAEEGIDLIRELGRRKTREFIENWLYQAYDDGTSYSVEIRFADEPVPSVPPEKGTQNKRESESEMR